MFTLDTSGVEARLITPSFGVPEQELTSLRTGARRYVQEWLAERQKSEHAWSMDPYDKVTVDRCKETARQAKALGVQTVVWVGIGGSGLGPRVIQDVYESHNTLEFIVIDTIDPSVLNLYLQVIDWKSTLVVVVSKSGDTLETMSAFFLCWEQLRTAMKDEAAERVIAITDPLKGALRAFCLTEGIKMLPIPPDVGGRFCIFTPVGLLPLALLDGDVDAFVRGAKEMDTLCQQTDLDENPALKLAAIQFILDLKRGYPVRVIMPYIQRLQSLSRWNQQLIAESLGKKETQNPIPLAAIGTQDQHSLLQQWLAGPRKCWHIFIAEVEKPRVYVPDDVPESFTSIAGKTFGQLLDACAEGTARALTSVKRPHVTISLTRLDSHHLGELFFFFLAEVVFLGKLYRIDPYGQPAVEIGKTITKEILTKGRGA